MRFGKDSLSYLLSCILSTVCLAGCTNSLVQRNHNIGEQSRAAAATGVLLIIKTTDLSAAGYALSVGSGGVALFAKVFFLSPLMLAINIVLILASGIAVTYLGRHGVASAVAYLGTVKIPDSVLQAQIKAGGVPLTYWYNGYVRFMVASAWPQMIPNFFSLYFAYKAYQIEKPSAYRQREMAQQSSYAPETPHLEEKPEVQHIA